MRSTSEVLQRNQQQKTTELSARNSFESLINEIVEQTDERDKKKLAALFAVQARTLRLTPTDLHYLLKKKDDPAIRNYTGFVKWSFGLTKKKAGSNPGLASNGK